MSREREPRGAGWLDRLLSRVFGGDEEWVLGDLEERRDKRRGVVGVLALIRDVASLVAWSLARGPWRGAGLWHDLRFAARALRKDVAFTSAALLTLAVGVGANATVFTVVRATLLEPLPYSDADRLAMIWSEIPARGLGAVTSAHGNVQDWREQNQAFADLATYDPATRTLTGGDWPEQIATADVSASFFSVLAVGPLIGRAFTVEEERRRAPVAVVSHDLWERLLGSSPAVPGPTVEIDRASYQIVGVMPEGFSFPDGNTQVWLPQTLLPGWQVRAARRGTDSWRVVGRLAPGSSLEQARMEMDGIARRLEQAHPRENAGLGVRVVPLLDHVTGESYRLALWTLFAAVAVLLLIACANVASLFLARGVRRARELSLRRALGATRIHLIRMSLSEAVILSLAAGMLGISLAIGGTRLLLSLAPANMPRLDEVSVDPAVVLYTITVALALGGLFGITPMWWSRRCLEDGLRGGRATSSHGPGRGGRSVLVVLQLALAVVLVFGTNLLVRSYLEVRSVDPGFETENVLIANLRVDSSTDPAAFYERVLEDVRSIPGVRAVGLVEDLIISGAPNLPITLEAPTRPETDFEALRIDAVAGDFLRSIGVRLVEGRDLNAADRSAPAVALVNETMATRLWPGETAVGKRFRTGARWIEVVGVVADMRRRGLERPPIAQAFVPYSLVPSASMNLLVRTDGTLPGLASAVRGRVAAIDRTVPLYRVTTVAETVGGQLVERRFQSLLLALFSTVALALAVLGVHGVVQYTVSQRTREVGIRMALGAAPGGIVSMVLRQGLALALVGSAVGLALAVWLSRAIDALLFGVAASDLASLSSTIGSLIATTLLACYLPARQASSVDAVVALREG